MKSLSTLASAMVLALGLAAATAQAQSCTPPTNVAVTSPTTTTAVVSFAPVAAASSYTVRYFWTGDSTAAGMMNVNVTTSPATLTGLRPRDYYVVRVVSNCGSGGTASSPAQVFQTTGTVTCAAPTNLVFSGITTTTASVGFSGGSGTYYVQYYPTGNSAQARTVTVSASPAALAGLLPATSYTVRVTASCGNGTVSAALTGTLRTTATAGCGPVTNVTAGASGSTTGFVAFSPIAGVSSYTIRYFAVGDSINTRTLPATGSPVPLSGLLPGTTYVVYLTPNCFNGAAPVPVRAAFTTRTASSCGAVTNVVLTATSATTARVSFTPGAGNTRFTVSYYIAGDSTRWVTSASSPVQLAGLVVGQTYHIQVTSVCGTGGGATSNNSPSMTFQFRVGATLGSRAQLGLGAISVFPNPVHRTASLLLPAVAGASKAQLALFNAVGQQVRSATVALTAGGTSAQLDLSGVAPGLYILRMSAGGQSSSQRVAVE